ncbi:MAG: molybdate ABC transporter substrate-binding protein [Candidatus Adiutrix sp.]|jgi:molybdate transport system substrate-binding protein|nr:molybdate ABC transporter substrate-binding protein [Candidatus Adiutrix sp.]
MKKLLLALVAVFLIWPALAQADEFQVAVAANFTEPSKAIAAAFEKGTGHRAVLIFGPTGGFETQIRQGAPFSILLAANTKTPKNLEKDGLTKPGSRFTYAKGALALWSAQKGFVDDLGEVLKTDKFKYLAVADPDLAPYGKAAYEVLKAWNLLEPLQKAKKIVTGNDIGKTLQLVDSGNADIGFVAWSQVCRNGKLTKGSVWQVPGNLHKPIIQDAVILKSAANNAAVQAFADYLKSPKARDIILSYGYTLP